MSEHAARRRAAWETAVGLVGMLAATWVAGDSMLETIAASALFTVGVGAFGHAGVMILKGLRRTARAGRRGRDEPEP
jgi:hypothetical protein